MLLLCHKHFSVVIKHLWTRLFNSPTSSPLSGMYLQSDLCCLAAINLHSLSHDGQSLVQRMLPLVPIQVVLSRVNRHSLKNLDLPLWCPLSRSPLERFLPIKRQLPAPPLSG